MATVYPREFVPIPVKAGSNHRFDVHLFTDMRLKTKNTGETTSGWRVVVTNPSASTVGYGLTASSASLGRFYFNLTGASHTATGNTHKIDVFKTGELRPQRFQFEQV